MLKLYRAWLEQLFYALVFSKDILEQKGIHSTNDKPEQRLQQFVVDNHYKNRKYLSPTDVNYAISLIADRGQTFEPLDELLKDITALLATKDTSGSDGDLIEQIVDILRLPHARNTLSGDALKTLRKAILLPEERAKFINTTQQREMACVACGHQFEPCELTVFSHEGFYCNNCVRPESVVCRHCNEGTSLIPDKMQQGLSKLGDCGCRERKRQDIPTPEPEIVTRVTPIGDTPAEPSQAAVRWSTLAQAPHISFIGTDVGFITTGTGDTDAPIEQPANPVPPVRGIDVALMEQLRREAAAVAEQPEP